MQTVCLLILSTIAVAAAIFWLRSVLIPFVLALFFALSLAPLIDLQIRYLRMPRALAVLATLVLAFVILRVIAGLVLMSVAQLSENASAYQGQIEQLAARFARALEGFGIDPATTFDPRSLLPAERVRSMLVGTTNAIVGVLSKGALVMVFLLFLLMGQAPRSEPASGVRGEVESRVKRYIVTKLSTSAATGLLVGAVLAVLGVDLALVFGLFAFLLNFIPSVGSIIATLLPLPVVMVSPDVSSTTAVLAIALPAVIQVVIGNFIEPQLMGSSLDLHPVTILLALILWGTLWGIVGMLLATPITAVLKILFEKTELTAPIAELLAGRLGYGSG